MSETDRRARARAKGRSRRRHARHSFFSDLASFGDFSGISNLSGYRASPPDWIIIVADIQGSTDAIGDGRYKDVNMVGAACIMAVLNVTRGFEMPYVFGGDGATMLIPPQALERAREALRKLRHLAHVEFSLTLRVGAVPVSRILADGRQVLVAKYEMSPGNYLASFAGGGIAHADRLIKEDDGSSDFVFDYGSGDERPDLEGLSCRWEPLAALRGTMVSLLIQALSNDPEQAASVYRTVVAEITRALDQDLSGRRPVKAENMKFVWPPQGLAAEARATHAGRGYYKRLWHLYKQSFIQWFMDRFKLSAGSFNAPVYRQELRDNSDFLKFDDMIRMVLDCTADDIRAIEAVLGKYHRDKQLVYGLHQADRALMTCLLFSLEKSRHVHFIDGADGGFALAARQLKAQLKALDDGPG